VNYIDVQSAQLLLLKVKAGEDWFGRPHQAKLMTFAYYF